MKDNKGFTLVELIVVIVILAILAAILVPALLGYIDRAKGQQTLIDARAAYQDVQTTFTEYYAYHSEDFKEFFDSLGKNYGFIDDKGVKHKAACLTSQTLSSIQQQGTEIKVQQLLDSYKDNKTSYLRYSIATELLRKDDSLFRKNAKHVYTGTQGADGKSYNDFYESLSDNDKKTVNPIIYQLYYDEKGRILLFEYGANGYLVRFYDGKVTVESNGTTFNRTY